MTRELPHQQKQPNEREKGYNMIIFHWHILFVLYTSVAHSASLEWHFHLFHIDIGLRNSSGVDSKDNIHHNTEGSVSSKMSSLSLQYYNVGQRHENVHAC